ncbi:MAG: TraR/DksA C4-type zinc finger protein [Proteobacteria bacterium]|nr:TraR/DksA C4-type zinc finger protein [Pseudomonadota bacterium]MBU1649302.1 TraR/DksA C4-type zinc finger protein [Pseudomonadota bacterium]
MSEKDLTHLKDLLLRQRREILVRLQGLESDWQALSERDIEREEEAQKADLASLFDQLEERERQELEDIELALTKMVNVTYGICEKCRKQLSLERLEVLPATRFCRKCEAEMEEKQKKPAILP